MTRLRSVRPARLTVCPAVCLAACLLALLALLASGCERERIEVTAMAGPHSYGREDLVAAVDRFAHSSRTPSDYHAMAVEIERMTPQFNALVAAEAERNLVFLALEPLDAYHGATPDAQLLALALTVWPTALGHAPAPNEDAWSYTRRLCSEPLARECKQVVAEYRATVLSQLVWSRLKERARLALNACEECVDEPRYAEAVARFEERDSELTARAGEIARRSHPRHWPIAGEHAADWSKPPLVTLRADGTAQLDEHNLSPGSWSEALAAVRGDGDTLGVWIGPTSDLSRLRSLGQTARKAGFHQLALQTRTAQHPYELREYRVALARRSTLPLRDGDSIQLLVNALDAALAAGQAIPAL
jgi:hypothetical protein